jgi:hypothetical protein
MPSFQPVLLSCLLILSCTSCSIQQTPAAIDPIALKTGPSSRTLNMYDNLRLSEDIEITFKSIDDQRCPLDSVCAWEGEAYAGFLVKQGGKPDTTISLDWAAVHNHDPAARYKRIAGYRIYLMSLEPIPSTEQPLPAKLYKAELKIELDQ